MYYSQREWQKSQLYHEEALAIRQELIKEQPQLYSDLAMSFFNLGVLLSEISQYQRAEKMYKNAVYIYEELVKKEGSQFLPNVAGGYKNLGILYRNMNKFKKSERAYQTSIQLYQILGKKYPITFLPQLASIHRSLGNLYQNKRKWKSAEKQFLKELTVDEQLYVIQPKDFLHNITIDMVNLSIFYFQHLSDKKNALLYAKKAIQLFLELEDRGLFQQLTDAIYQVVDGLGLSLQDLFSEAGLEISIVVKEE